MKTVKSKKGKPSKKIKISEARDGLINNPGRKVPYYLWNRDQVLEALRQRMRQGLSMRSEKVYRDLPSVWRAAQRIFGSWKKVRQALGIELDKMARWTVRRLIANLRPLCEQTHLSLRQRQRRVYLWTLVMRHFPSRTVVMEKFGIPEGGHGGRSRIWSREKIIQCLQDRVKRKQPINTGTICRDGDSLYDAAGHYFGSYRKAVEAAGYDYTRIGQWLIGRRSKFGGLQADRQTGSA